MAREKKPVHRVQLTEAEMDGHLGYEKSERSDIDDYRNGYKLKRVNSRYGSMEIEIPQDRKSTFQPQAVKKRHKDISDIDQKIISIYEKWMTTWPISETLEGQRGCHFANLQVFWGCQEGHIHDQCHRITEFYLLETQPPAQRISKRYGSAEGPVSGNL